MTDNVPILDYARVPGRRMRRLTPATLAAVGVAFYLLVFVLLPTDADVRSDGWMRFWASVLLVGPPCALSVLVWASLEARRMHRLRTAMPAIGATALMMALWFILLTGYLNTKRDIEAVRARFIQQSRQPAGGPR